jgi:hypothetical protein
MKRKTFFARQWPPGKNSGAANSDDPEHQIRKMQIFEHPPIQLSNRSIEENVERRNYNCSRHMHYDSEHISEHTTQ